MDDSVHPYLRKVCCRIFVDSESCFFGVFKVTMQRHCIELTFTDLFSAKCRIPKNQLGGGSETIITDLN